jgi:hypothetical protein
MKPSFERPVATVLACLMLVLPGALSARDRRGTDIRVALKDGRTVTGELIAVKPDSLLLLGPAGKDESIGVADIATIRILKKRRPGRGALYGTLIGGAAGGLVGYAALPKGMDEYPGLIAMGIGFCTAVLGGFIGLVSQSGSDLGKEIVIAGRPEAEVKGSWARLNRLARLRSLP